MKQKMNKLKRERFTYLIIKIIPALLNRIKNFYYSYIFKTKQLRLGKNISFSGTKNISIGHNVLIGNQAWIDAISDGKISIGNNVSFSQNVHIASKYSVKIGNGCLIGSDVLITDHNHTTGLMHRDILPKNRELDVKGKTEIGENTWLSDNVKILSGVILGKNCVVAANSVVICNFPSDVVIGGIPAKIIKNFNLATIEKN